MMFNIFGCIFAFIAVKIQRGLHDYFNDEQANGPIDEGDYSTYGYWMCMLLYVFKTLVDIAWYKYIAGGNLMTRTKNLIWIRVLVFDLVIFTSICYFANHEEISKASAWL